MLTVKTVELSCKVPTENLDDFQRENRAGTHNAEFDDPLPDLEEAVILRGV